MKWSQQSDNYCERTDFTFWSEPMNAISNIGFVLAAVWMWKRAGGLRAARLLCAILFAVGVGSFLFHTYATNWAELADVVPIALFILTYLFLVHRDFLGLHWAWSLLATACFAPYAFVMVPVLDSIPFVRISNFYWSVPILLMAYAPLVWRRAPDTARGMVYGALMLCVSITIRSVDEELCKNWPVGTHFIWHLLNACMLVWMIEVYRRHRLAQG